MSGKPAGLAADLLFTKGRASPAGFLPSSFAAFQQKPPRPAIPLRPMAVRPAPAQQVHHSFHLDAERHRQFKLAATQLGWTGQDFASAAIAHYLANVVPTLLPNCPCLAKGQDTASLVDDCACRSTPVASSRS